MRNTRATIMSNFEVAPATGCHHWLGTVDKDGYPLVKWNGKTHRALRLLWLFRTGQAPPARVMIMHKCDNPACVNQDHLALGSALDNRRDCIAKGRHATGAQITQNRNTATGDRHGSKTCPQSVRRGVAHHGFGKPATAARDEKGRFTRGEMA